LTRYLVRAAQWKVREESLLERKNPFGPEERTALSVRNPVLEAARKRGAGAVVDVNAPPIAVASDATPTRPPPGSPDELEVRRTHDTAGPTTQRPRLPSQAVARIVMNVSRIRALPIGPREAFLLAHVDGSSNVHTLVDITGMTPLEVVRILERLTDLGAIEFA
jgi:hypothetical protein